MMFIGYIDRVYIDIVVHRSITIYQSIYQSIYHLSILLGSALEVMFQLLCQKDMGNVEFLFFTKKSPRSFLGHVMNTNFRPVLFEEKEQLGETFIWHLIRRLINQLKHPVNYFPWNSLFPHGVQKISIKTLLGTLLKSRFLLMI